MDAMTNRRLLLAALAAGPVGLALPARAQPATRIAFGYTAATEFASVFVAAEQGCFRKRNLDVELRFIPLNSTIPAALQSDSLQIGGPTASVFLQAVDGGLDLVLVSGGGLTSKTITAFGLVARPGAGIKGAGDCVGRKIGVPGLGAFLHVTFRAWLRSQGVDYRQVSFVEIPLPQHADLLRGGSVDAVITADPYMSRIVESGAGYVASYYTTFLPEGHHTIVHAARRDWVQKHPEAARGFREAIQEASAFMQQPKNDAQVRAGIGKYIKLPPEVLAKAQISPPGPLVSEKQLAYWVGVMKEQGMLRRPIEVSTLIAR
jgi:NitT/TauT family transport system substrate-binding protein